MADIYPSVDALVQSLGTDAFRVIVNRSRVKGKRRSRRSNGITADQVTIISPHGGFIEAGTSAIATATAGSCFNRFDFQGLQEARPEELHVTSTNFRHPELTRLLHSSAVAVSIHGMGDQGHKSIWLGGLNKELKTLVLENLRLAGFSVNPESPRYRGINPRNFVNMACHRGVQLELSNELLADLFAGPRFHRTKPAVTTQQFHDLVKTLRLSIGQWCSSHHGCRCARRCCQVDDAAT